MFIDYNFDERRRKLMGRKLEFLQDNFSVLLCQSITMKLELFFFNIFFMLSINDDLRLRCHRHRHRLRGHAQNEQNVVYRRDLKFVPPSLASLNLSPEKIQDIRNFLWRRCRIFRRRIYFTL
jgi:hypothetical protein